MITIYRDSDGFTVSGHAGYAEPGQDIVCAAVSALVQTFITSVMELTTDNIRSDTEPGNAYVRYKNLSEKSKTLLDSFFIGVQMIADTYPQNLF